MEHQLIVIFQRAAAISRAYVLVVLEGVRCTLLMFGRLHCLGLLAYQECVVLFVFRGAHCGRGCLSIPTRILGLPV